ncbi:MAG: carbon-nitrogen family hydrolase [Acidaminococcaceae bacterium]
MKIALVQMNIQEKNKTANVENGLELLQQAVVGNDIVLMPEIWTTGYSLSRLEMEAEELTGPVVQRVQALAQQHKCAVIAGSVPLRLEGKIYNTAIAVNREGAIVSLYSKMHLFGLFHEENFFAAGASYETYQLGEASCATAICYDLRFPELFRRLALKGAQVIFVPAEWPEMRGDVWRLLLQARAMENGIYICAVNCVGTFKGESFYGHSMIVAPDGSIVTEGSGDAGIITGAIDLATIIHVRKRINALADIRPELFAK